MIHLRCLFLRLLLLLQFRLLLQPLELLKLLQLSLRHRWLTGNLYELLLRHLTHLGLFHFTLLSLLDLYNLLNFLRWLLYLLNWLLLLLWLFLNFLLNQFSLVCFLLCDLLNGLLDESGVLLLFPFAEGFGLLYGAPHSLLFLGAFSLLGDSDGLQHLFVLCLGSRL